MLFGITNFIISTPEGTGLSVLVHYMRDALLDHTPGVIPVLLHYTANGFADVHNRIKDTDRDGLDAQVLVQFSGIKVAILKKVHVILGVAVTGLPLGPETAPNLHELAHILVQQLTRLSGGAHDQAHARVLGRVQAPGKGRLAREIPRVRLRLVPNKERVVYIYVVHVHQNQVAHFILIKYRSLSWFSLPFYGLGPRLATFFPQSRYLF